MTPNKSTSVQAGRLKVKKEFPHCIDCGYPLLPRPVEYRDGCFIRPLYCAFCDEEKDILTVVIVERKPDDLPRLAVRR